MGVMRMRMMMKVKRRRRSSVGVWAVGQRSSGSSSKCRSSSRSHSSSGRHRCNRRSKRSQVWCKGATKLALLGCRAGASWQKGHLNRHQSNRCNSSRGSSSRYDRHSRQNSRRRNKGVVQQPKRVTVTGEALQLGEAVHKAAHRALYLLLVRVLHLLQVGKALHRSKRKRDCHRRSHALKHSSRYNSSSSP